MKERELNVRGWTKQAGVVEGTLRNFLVKAQIEKPLRKEIVE